MVVREDSMYLFGHWAVTIRGDGPILEVFLGRALLREDAFHGSRDIFKNPAPKRVNAARYERDTDDSGHGDQSDN